jgi:ABC-2 type transport system ATP-binding protein
MNNISIRVKGLKKYYGQVKAVDGISFEVKSGSIFGMLGPNGAGKTTTIETLVGLNKKDAGEIEILGYNPDRELEKIKKMVGVQLQSPSLFPRLTVKEIIKLFGSFYPDPLDTREVMERVGLEKKANDQVKSLSGGQRHRLAVGIAMVSNGNIIFLDEPTTGLDPQARRQLWEVISALKGEGKTVFLTTHYMDEAEKLCDFLVIIDRGKVIASGSPAELIRNNFQETAVEFLDPGLTEDEKEKLAELELARRLSYEGEEKHIILYTEEVPKTVKGLLDYSNEIGKPIDDIIVRHASLEDVFLKLTGRGIRE